MRTFLLSLLFSAALFAQSSGFPPSQASVIGTGLNAVSQASSYVAHGDSITAGYLACGTTGTSPSCDYATLLATDAKATLSLEATTGYTSCDIDATQTFIKDLPQAVDANPFYSYIIGTNDANDEGVGSYEAGVFQPCHKAMISWNAIGNKYDTTASTGTICTNSSTFTFQAGGNQTTEWAMNNDLSSTVGQSKTCTITTQGNPLYFWYFVQDTMSGSFSYTVDGGAAVTLHNYTTPIIKLGLSSPHVNYAWLSQRIPIAAGTHTIVFTNVSASGGAVGGMNIMGLGTAPSKHYYNEPKVFVGGIPRPQFDLNAGSTSPFATYDADVQADVAQLAGDGMNVYFVNVRNYLCTRFGTVSGVANSCLNDQGVADMNNQTVDPPSGSGGTYSLHPNTQGHIDLKRAFEEAMQFVPYASGSSSGTVSSASSGQFAYYSSAGTTVSGHTLVAGDIPQLAYSSLSGLPTLTGTAAKTATSAGYTSGNCAYWTATGDIGDTGTPCGTGSGGSGATIASTTHLIAGSGTGNGVDSGIATTAVVTLTGTQTLTNKSISASQVTGLATSATTDTTSASNITSGTLPDAQLPTDQCVLNTYPVTGASLTGTPATATVTLVTLASINVRICFLEIMPSTAFSVTNATGGTVQIVSSGSTPIIYSPAVNTETISANNFWSDAGSVADRSTGGQGVVAQFAFPGATSLTGATGQVNIVVGTRTVPAGY